MNPCHYCGKPILDGAPYAHVAKPVDGGTNLFVAHIDCDLSEREKLSGPETCPSVVRKDGLVPKRISPTRFKLVEEEVVTRCELPVGHEGGHRNGLAMWDRGSWKADADGVMHYERTV